MASHFIVFPKCSKIALEQDQWDHQISILPHPSSHANQEEPSNPTLAKPSLELRITGPPAPPLEKGGMACVAPSESDSEPPFKSCLGQQMPKQKVPLRGWKRIGFVDTGVLPGDWKTTAQSCAQPGIASQKALLSEASSGGLSVCSNYIWQCKPKRPVT